MSNNSSFAEIAEEVFDRCIDFNRDQDFKDPDLEITFDFQYLDDTYSAATWGDPKKVKVKNTQSKNMPDKNMQVLPRFLPSFVHVFS